MGKVFTALHALPKRTTAVVATLAAAVIVPAAVFAWGPTRPTYTVEQPADHITFNSITNNPDYGDERNFVRIKDVANTSAGGWSDNLAVQPGKEYWVQMYVHNNAASSLNLKATNTRVMAAVPNTTGKSVTVEGFITADNASPKQVWDQAVFTSDKDFNLTYQAGSTKMYNKSFPNGTPINDSIVTNTGALVGFDKMDGVFPGCFHYSGYVSFKVKVGGGQANFNVNKAVSKHGANDWKENYTATPGETVDYRIEYKNTDAVKQNNVVIKDKLPAGMTYVNGSTKFGTAAKPEGQQASDNITTTGINIGSYSQNQGTWVIFSAKVDDNNALKLCGPNTLRNVARAETDYGYKEDGADVTVNKTCQPGMINVCVLATKATKQIKESEFDSKLYSKNLADCNAVCVTPSGQTMPAGSPECEKCPVEGKENLSKNDSNCTTPLPETGIDGTIATIAGLGGLTAAAAYAASSSRIRKLLIG